MASPIDNGPATPSGSTGVLFAGQTASIELHLGNPPSISIGQIATGVDPLGPAQAPYLDPSVTYSGITGTQFTPLNKTVNFANAPGTANLIVNPA